MFWWIITVLIIAFLLFMYPSDKSNTIRTLVRQSARWALAARQDENVMIAVLHANYAAGYWWAVRDIATDTEIFLATGIDVIAFRNSITETQDSVTSRLAKVCAKFAPSDMADLDLVKVGGKKMNS